MGGRWGRLKTVAQDTVVNVKLVPQAPTVSAPPGANGFVGREERGKGHSLGPGPGCPRS